MTSSGVTSERIADFNGPTYGYSLGTYADTSSKQYEKQVELAIGKATVLGHHAAGPLTTWSDTIDKLAARAPAPTHAVTRASTTL